MISSINLRRCEICLSVQRTNLQKEEETGEEGGDPDQIEEEGEGGNDVPEPKVDPSTGNVIDPNTGEQLDPNDYTPIDPNSSDLDGIGALVDDDLNVHVEGDVQE